MEALGKTKRQIVAISNVLKAIAQTRSISEARNQLKKGGINIKNEKEKPKLALSAPQFNRNCAKLEDMGINPVTIPREWKISTLDGIYNLIEKHFLEFSKANAS